MEAQSKTMLITGAGSGLGRGLALALAGEGNRILATDVNAETVGETITQIREAGGEAAGSVLDVTSDDSVRQAMAAFADQPIGVLINNAGLQHVAPLEDFPQDAWDRLINVLLQGACRMTRAVLPGMRARGFGRIVNIGSIHALVASPYKSAYVAAKHGLLGFSKAIALETGDVDVTINTICPSYIRTPLVEAQIQSQAKVHGISEAEVIDRIMLEPMPKKAFIEIEEVAAAVTFLVSPGARNITGQCITIDGGWTAR